MKEPQFIVTERFISTSEQERRQIIREKMERCQRHALEGREAGGDPPEEP